MTDMNNRDIEYIEAVAEEEMYCEDGCECESAQITAQEMFEEYCDNLVFPDEDKCIEPKKLYITLGSAFAGAVALFLFIGWLLCYCPLNHTGFSANDFIAEYNAIVSEGDASQATFEEAVAALVPSPSDVVVRYPDFSQLTIPENANLEKGVELCNGNVIVKADLVGGNIQKLTVSLSDKCTSYNPNRYSFTAAESVDIDYSHFPNYAAAGKARLAFYNLVRRQNGLESTEYTISDAIGYCSSMIQGAIYSFADAEDYDPNQSYFEYSDNLSLSFTPIDFCFTANSREHTLIDSDNGIYKFFDSIFGKVEKENDKNESADDSAAADSTAVADTSASDTE